MIVTYVQCIVKNDDVTKRLDVGCGLKRKKQL